MPVEIKRVEPDLEFEDHRWYTIVRQGGKFLRAFCGGQEFSGLGVYEADQEAEFEQWRAGG